MNPGRVEWGAGELPARTALGLDDASGVADTGRADQAADDDESAGHADSQLEGVERGGVRARADRRRPSRRDAGENGVPD
jgi:hypothetical protein